MSPPAAGTSSTLHRRRTWCTWVRWSAERGDRSTVNQWEYVAVPVALRPVSRVGCCHGAGEFVSGADGEFAVGVAEVHLHGLQAEVEGLGDLSVAESVGRHGGDSEFAGGERVAAGLGAPAGPDAGAEQLVVGPSGERVCPAAVGELETGAELLESLVAVACAAQRGAEFDQRVRLFESSFGTLQHGGGFVQLHETARTGQQAGGA